MIVLGLGYLIHAKCLIKGIFESTVRFTKIGHTRIANLQGTVPINAFLFVSYLHKLSSKDADAGGHEGTAMPSERWAGQGRT